MIADVTMCPYFTAWQKCHKPPLKNFDFDKFTVFFYGIIDLPKNKIYLNQYDMLSFRERPCRF